MPKVDDPSNLKEIVRQQAARIRALETASPLANTSTERGRTRWFAGSEVLIEDSNLTVTGTQTVTGALNLAGTQSVTGALNLTGTQTISGGGQLNVGPMSISPSGPYGAAISSAGTIYLDSTTVWMVGETVASGGLAAFGMPTTTNPANVRRTSLGVFQEVTSAARFKIDPQPADLPDSLLDVPVLAWVDRNDAESIAELWDAPRPLSFAQQRKFDDASLSRVPGVIAEQVAEAGGELFVSRKPDGEILGVEYDRLALARTEILARRLEAALARIEELEKAQ